MHFSIQSVIIIIVFIIILVTINVAIILFIMITIVTVLLSLSYFSYYYDYHYFSLYNIIQSLPYPFILIIASANIYFHITMFSSITFHLYLQLLSCPFQSLQSLFVKKYIRFYILFKLEVTMTNILQ